MKDMDKYNEALERAKAAYGTGAYDDATLEFIFPQLCETEDERIREHIVEILDSLPGCYWYGQKEKDDSLAWLEKQKEPRNYRKLYEEVVNSDWFKQNYVGKSLGEEQKPAEWSEEDSDNLERIDDYLWMLDNYVGDDCAMPQGKTDKIRGNIQGVLSPWIKSLPERFVPQPKPEWSAEDECRREGIIQWLREYQKKFNPEYDSLSIESIESLISWLKSLKPRWKPSEAHLSALLAVFNDPNNIGSQTCQLALTDLYEQLKAIKEDK